jgi:hypothetical protein
VVGMAWIATTVAAASREYLARLDESDCEGI